MVIFCRAYWRVVKICTKFASRVYCIFAQLTNSNVSEKLIPISVTRTMGKLLLVDLAKVQYTRDGEDYPGSRGSLRGERNERGERGEPLVTSVANPTSTLDTFRI
jgi:hypothetical protein